MVFRGPMRSLSGTAPGGGIGRARNVARIGLGTVLMFAGLSHLTIARNDFRAQVPPWLPLEEDTVVVASGVVEIGLGALIASGFQRRLVGLAAATFFVAIFPGNISQWRQQRDAFGLDTDARRLARLPMQLPLIATALWSTGALRRGC